MKLIPVHFIWKKPRAFWSVFAAPLLSTFAGCLIDPPHWFSYAATLSCSFIVTLTIVESLSTQRIEDNWGRLEKKDHPRRYWIQVSIWIAMLICATAFPIVFAWARTRA